METFTEERFSACYLQYRPMVRNYIAARIADPSLADDLAQDVFEQLWRCREDIRIPSMHNLLFTIMRHTVVDYIRHYRRRDWQAGYMEQETSAARTVADETAQRCLFRELHHLHTEAVGRLPARRRHIYRLYFREGLSYSSIASELSISERTVGTQLCLAFRMIRAGVDAAYRYKAG